MNALLVLPLMLPLTSAAVALVAWRSRRAQRWLGVAGTAALLASGLALLAMVYQRGILVSHIGAWPAPYGITLAADLFSAIMVVLAGVIGLAVAVYSLGSMDARREMFGYYPLLLILLMGVCGAFLTGDIFNLYVWFEVMLMASFVLLALGGERGQLQGGIFYVTLNLLSSAIFLAAVGILYGVVGTLNFADLAGKLDAEPGLATVLAVMFLIAFGIKAAVFPLFFWLPASYHTPPVAIAAVFAGLLTKVGVYALIRVFTLLFHQEPAFTHGLILVIAGFTMVTGVLGAAAQYDFRRILSFHIVSQIGYMIMGLGLAGLVSDPALQRLALAGSIFYVMHHIIVKTNLFLISGLAAKLQGTYELKDLGGLYRDRPGLALLFLIPALSLAGMPPLSGFFAKLALIRAGLEAQRYVIVAVALVVGLLTLFSMTKIWAEAFWKPRPQKTPTLPPGEETRRTPRGYKRMLVPAVALAAITVVIGLGGEVFFRLALDAADQLLDRTGYVAAVLGDAP
jgi:multicomponent Na+:H+ antiporter subunit D